MFCGFLTIGGIMNKSIKLLLVGLLCISLSACNPNINLVTETENSTSITTEESVAKTETETETETKKILSDSETNYGIYSSLIDAYEVTAHQSYDGSPSFIDESIYEHLVIGRTNHLGVNYKLIDFDQNGVYELVVTALNITNSDKLTSIVCEEFVTKVFTINSNNELVFVDDFPLFLDETYEGKPILSLVTTEVDGETYIVTGYTTENTPRVSYNVWQYTDDGFDFVINFYADINTDTSMYENALVNSSDVSNEEFCELQMKWISNSNFSTYVGADEEFAKENVDKPRNETLEFLSQYEKCDGDFGDAAFHEGKSIIFETKPQSDAEELIKQYFKDCVLPDEKYLDYTALPEFVYNKFNMIPCGIVRDFSTVKKEDFAAESIYMKEQLSTEVMQSAFDQCGPENEFAIRVETEFFKDFDVLQLEPQSGMGENTDWFVLGENPNSVSDYKIYASIGTSDVMMDSNMTDAFEVIFLGYRDDLIYEGNNLNFTTINEKSYYTPLQRCLTLPEILQTEVVDDLFGDEIYLIKTSNDYEFELSVYEYDENDKEIEVKTIGNYDEPIILSCNNYDNFYKAKLSVTYPSGNVYTYSPNLLPRYYYTDYDADYNTDYGKYAKPYQEIDTEIFEFMPATESEIHEKLNGKWSIDGADDTAYIEISNWNYATYLANGIAESYATFGYDGAFFNTAIFSLYQDGEYTGTYFYYVDDNTIMLQHNNGELTTFIRN